MIDWTELRTAYKVALLGTVSAAADELGIHRASVVRHIDSVEEQLGQKIFIRNNRGYQPTDNGVELFKVAELTESQLNIMVRKSHDMVSDQSGELIVGLPEIVTPMYMPAIDEFQRSYPNIKLEILSGEHVGQLEFGESHILIQPAEMLDHPDYINQKLMDDKIQLYSSKEYKNRFGVPKTVEDFNHRFFDHTHGESPSDFEEWLHKNVPAENFILASNSLEFSRRATIDGHVINFIPARLASFNKELVPIPGFPTWAFAVWVVTHRDIHRMPNVQAFLGILKRTIKLAK